MDSVDRVDKHTRIEAGRSRSNRLRWRPMFVAPLLMLSASLWLKAAAG